MTVLLGVSKLSFDTIENKCLFPMKYKNEFSPEDEFEFYKSPIFILYKIYGELYVLISFRIWYTYHKNTSIYIPTMEITVSVSNRNTHWLRPTNISNIYTATELA